LACPYFLPDERRDDILWPHPARLPLGAGFGGCCTAAGHEGARPSDEELKNHCNLGYARCSRLPSERVADAVRYAVALDGDERVVVTWVTERAHAPVECGHVEYDRAAQEFSVAHPDARIQKQVESYLAIYLARRPARELAKSAP